MTFERKPRRHFHNVMMNPAFQSRQYKRSHAAKIESDVEYFILKLARKFNFLRFWK